MKVTRFIAYTVLATSFGFSALHAKSLRDGVTPAEFPPATFKGEQYVDSKGCIYIRAGIDGNVTWVPRVSRKRQQVCGYKPSLTAAQIASAPITKPSGPAPVQITVAPTAASPSKPAPAAAAKKPRTTSAAPAPVAAAASAPVAVAAAPAKPAARAPRRAPEPLVFVNPPPERVAAATVPTAPTTARTTAPRPAPVPLLFVNPPPEKVAAAQVPTATTTTRPARHTASSRPEPQPLVYVNNPPAVQTTSSAARATPASTTAAGNDTCSGASALSRQYINSNARFPVRCGPQTQSAVTAYVPSTTQRTPTPPPAARPVPAPVQSAAAAPVPAPAVAPLAPATASTTVRAQNNGSCPGASAFSQQYINSSAKYPVRCGPQAASPVTSYRGAAGTGRVQAADTTTRIVPRHVYENRQNATSVQVAEGYQNVWKDDRLNPHRAERTAAPIVVRIPSRTPSGYKPAWDDDRLNTARAKGTAAGDAQSNQIWTQRLPRELIVPPVPADKQIVVLSSRNSTAPVARTSTRSAPKATGQVAGTPKYVRVAAYDSDASARSVAKKLAQSGLPMRLGTVTKKGKAYRVVLAGPFVSTEQASAALAKVRGAGYRSAKISK